MRRGRNYEAGSNFKPAFLFLDRKSRAALSVIYGYCRIVDDIADDDSKSEEEKRKELGEWREEIENIFSGGPLKKSFSRELAGTVEEFSMEKGPFLLLIEGMEMDTVKKRYSTISELEKYMYRVASSVALMCVPIFGLEKGEKSREYSRYLGYSLQIINIMRDVGEDLKMNRVYIPSEDMGKSGYSLRDLENRVYDGRFVSLMKIQHERANAYYGRLLEIGDSIKSSKLLPSYAMVEIYRRILKRIAEKAYNVFDDKPKPGRTDKVLAVFRAWRNVC